VLDLGRLSEITPAQNSGDPKMLNPIYTERQK
jgi:hypothetical protein